MLETFNLKVSLLRSQNISNILVSFTVLQTLSEYTQLLELNFLSAVMSVAHFNKIFNCILSSKHLLNNFPHKNYLQAFEPCEHRYFEFSLNALFNVDFCKSMILETSRNGLPEPLNMTKLCL